MKSWFRTEDTLAVVLGFLIVGLGLTPLVGVDLLGWAVAVKEWVDPAKALAPASGTYAALTGLGSLGATYAFLLVALSVGIATLGGKPGQFAVRFTVLFALAFACWTAGHYGYIAATPDKQKALGVEWSLGLTGEAGYLLALVGGLLIGNLSPRTAEWFKTASRSELYIKTGIVIYGAGLGVKAAEESSRAGVVLFRGLAAIVEAYLIYWALVYFVARKFFKFSREWAAPLASGISICGVSAAITTGAAIRARPVVPVMVSSLVVVFSVVEMLILPFAARTFLADEPMVAAAWMGLSVKTDGAAFASGTITESLVYAKAAENGHVYEKGWMTLTTTTVKVFIDLFIGVWAIVLGAVWAWKIDKQPGRGVPLADIWNRFPKFVFGYVLTFGVFLAVGLTHPEAVSAPKPTAHAPTAVKAEAKTEAAPPAKPPAVPALKRGTDQSDVFRRLFFVLTFFAIGLSANFKRLWAEGLGRLALVYVISLFGFVIWIGLAISWLFFHGVLPPLAPATGGS
ncbi:putative sulfate exporter family transporter [Fimbriiglobus ruber]|uniref:Inner membrane protein n=1 Tax=Fimbriiglobus ruber TaxID=1908690 RepID=A0A225DCJ2_9BACT|nr:putative sulfate exporter family transporter [Fimbriiglobus ruber]OWK36258.1 Inner membrane protein [Fimbriiglobus ruber]